MRRKIFDSRDFSNNTHLGDGASAEILFQDFIKKKNAKYNRVEGIVDAYGAACLIHIIVYFTRCVSVR